MRYQLSEDDVRILRDVVDRVRKDGQLSAGRTYTPGPEDGEVEAPEVYVVRAPVGGIPARSGSTPGTVECDVYQLDTTTSTLAVSAAQDRIVYNLSDSAIPADTWTRAVRDKFGRYFVEAAGSGTSSGTCTGCGWVAGLSQADCLKITVTSPSSGKCDCIPSQVLYLCYSNELGYWVSTDTTQTGTDEITFDSCCGHARIIFFLSDYEPKLRLDGTIVGCGGVDPSDFQFFFDCCTENVAYFKGGGGELCNSSPVACPDPDGNTFTLKVEAICCTEIPWVDGWYCVSTTDPVDCSAANSVCQYLTQHPGCDLVSSGAVCSGPYSTEAQCISYCESTGTGTTPVSPPPPPVSSACITTACGPGATIPGRLYVTFEGTGECACMNRSFAVNATGGVWVSESLNFCDESLNGADPFLHGFQFECFGAGPSFAFIWSDARLSCVAGCNLCQPQGAGTDLLNLATSCSPFLWVGTMVFDRTQDHDSPGYTDWENCCEGTVTVTISETPP
jgi:hypothetical protein